ncbi:MAG: hypothetical protein M0033_11325 [Nitrospiraceae bacterium]|nr:hypothetical protein [Nitrospiraceae bacterium]
MKKILFLTLFFLLVLSMAAWAAITLTGTNFAVSTLASPLLSNGTSLSVASGTGSKFPQTGNFKLVLFSAGCVQASACAQKEIITANFSNTPDVFNIVSRGDEATSAYGWNAGDKVVLAPTWAYFSQMIDSVNALQAQVNNLQGQVAFDKCRIYQAHAQSLPIYTWTKVTLDTSDFDTDSIADVATNHRITPKKAGYYMVSFSLASNATDGMVFYAGLYKNGAIYTEPGTPPGSANNFVISGGDLVYCNGTTDYLELWAYSAGSNTIPGSDTVFLSVVGPF